jgi:hypothetical protein
VRKSVVQFTQASKEMQQTFGFKFRKAKHALRRLIGIAEWLEEQYCF